MAKKATQKPRTRKTSKRNPARDRLEGNPSRRKPANKPAPRLLTEPPPPPEDLGEYALALWTRLADHLTSIRLLSPVDLEALRVLCDAWQTYRELSVYCNPDRAFFTTESGYVCQHPAVKLRASAGKTLENLWVRFGLTPRDREALEVDYTPDEPDSIQNFARAR